MRVKLEWIKKSRCRHKVHIKRTSHRWTWGLILVAFNDTKWSHNYLKAMRNKLMIDLFSICFYTTIGKLCDFEWRCNLHHTIFVKAFIITFSKFIMQKCFFQYIWTLILNFYGSISFQLVWNARIAVQATGNTRSCSF